MAELIIMFIILSVIVEALVGIVKRLLPDRIGPVETPLILGLVFGVIIAVLTRTDLLSALGFSVSSPLVAWILTGLAAGGGSKTAHELISKLRASRADIDRPPE